MGKKTKLILKTLVTSCLVFILIIKIDWFQAVAILKTINIWYFILISPLWLLGIFLSSIKWRLILAEYGIRITSQESFSLYWVGTFYNNFLPSSVGGDSYKFLYLNKQQPGQKTKILSSMILERGLGFLIMISFVIFFGLFFITSSRAAGWLILIYCLAGIFMLAGVYMLFFSNFQIKQVSRFLIINKVITGINSLLGFKNKKVILISLLISIVFLLLSIIYIYFSFSAFNYQVSLLLLLFVVPLINLSGILPIAINSIGLTEVVAVGVFSLWGISADIIILVFFTSRIHSIICSLSGGLRSIFPILKKK